MYMYVRRAAVAHLFALKVSVQPHVRQFIPSLSLQLADVLSVVFGHLCVLPRYLIPCYFEALVSLIHQLLTQAAIRKMSK